MGNKNLSSAAKAKNDEFYTQYSDIQRELNCYYLYDENFLRGKTVLLPCDDPQWSNFTKFFAANFELYGLKKLISTSYAAEKKKYIYKPMRSLFDDEDEPQFNNSMDFSHGRIYTLDEKSVAAVDYPLDALHNWKYLDGDGDFRSKEVKRLRDEADVIITNPPFSKFREFLAWILDAKKQFLIIGNINCITYKEVFPLIKDNKIWLGNGMGRWISGFIVPDGYELYGTEARIDADGNRIVATNQCLWLTNLEHGKRHEPLRLMTMENNFIASRHKEIRGVGYQKYDNYDAIEVPYVDAIPSDYEGVMGVPVTFLDKYCPEQFEILGMCENLDLYGLKTKIYTAQECSEQYFKLFGKPGTYDLNAAGVVNGKKMYQRILIRRRTT